MPHENHPKYTNRLWGVGHLFGVALVGFMFISTACSNTNDIVYTGDEHKEAMEWCHEQDGTYQSGIIRYSVNSETYVMFPVNDRCLIPPSPTTATSLPENCYTPNAEQTPGIPRNTNWYAYYLLGKNGAGAGGLDKYDHCKNLPVIRSGGS